MPVWTQQPLISVVGKFFAAHLNLLSNGVGHNTYKQPTQKYARHATKVGRLMKTYGTVRLLNVLNSSSTTSQNKRKPGPVNTVQQTKTDTYAAMKAKTSNN